MKWEEQVSPWCIGGGGGGCGQMVRVVVEVAKRVVCLVCGESYAIR